MVESPDWIGEMEAASKLVVKEKQQKPREHPRVINMRSSINALAGDMCASIPGLASTSPRASDLVTVTGLILG